MEIALFKLLLPIDFIANYLPAVRFRKSEYFIFFAFSCLVDPLNAFLTRIQVINCFYHVPFYLTLSLAILPGSYRKVRAYSGAGVFLVLFHYLNNREVMQISAAVLAICFIAFLINEIRVRNKNESKAELFLLLLALNMFIHYWAILLYFQLTRLYISYCWFFVFLDILTFTLMAWAGPERKINLAFLKIFSEKVNSAVKSQSQPEIIVDEINNEQTDNFSKGNAAADNGLSQLLSKREFEIFIYLSKGMSNKEIAERITRDIKTVETHLMHIKEKLGLKSVRELRKFINNVLLNRNNHKK